MDDSGVSAAVGLTGASFNDVPWRVLIHILANFVLQYVVYQYLKGDYNSRNRKRFIPQVHTHSFWTVTLNGLCLYSDNR